MAVERLTADQQNLVLQQRAHECGILPVAERADIDIAYFGPEHPTGGHPLDQAAAAVAPSMACRMHFRPPTIPSQGHSTTEMCRDISSGATRFTGEIRSTKS